MRMCGRVRTASRNAYAMCILLAMLLPRLGKGHQSLAKVSMSRHVACRIGFGSYCPGPCPNTEFRYDVNKNNPTMRWRRGQVVELRTLANNHEGGFSRWTLVPVKDMWNKNIHARNAFLWSCADTGRSKCDRRHRLRDCYYDAQNIFYRHYFKVPAIYPDGVYVLGWVWYGGGGTWGFFSDYYDCTYVQISGGARLAWRHDPQFIPGDSHLKKNGMCTATVNDIGICWREPCPGGGSFTKLFKPKQFTNRLPKPLFRWMFNHPYRIPKASVSIPTITIRRIANHLRPVWTGYADLSHPYLHLLSKQQITITCETRGNVAYVQWFVNGRKQGLDRFAPYSIAGDWQPYKRPTFKDTKFAAWRYYFDYRTTVISCMAKGRDGSEAWKTMELSTDKD